MNLLLASDSFKGSATTIEVVEALAKGIRKTSPSTQIQVHPMADGGEGTAEILAYHNEAQVATALATDPSMTHIEGRYFIDPSHTTAYIDMSEASGLHHVQGKDKNILAASTYGTGLIVKQALKQGAENIFLGLGGSATCDCGIGMASALGFRFLDKTNNEVYPIPLNFRQIQSIDASNAVIPKTLTPICDVSVPLLGKYGSIKYAPQKGANPSELTFLTQGMTHIAEIIDPYGSHIDAAGAGAAGGLGFACTALFKGHLVPGIDFLMNETKIRPLLEWADLVITGEGSFDLQTLDGKVVNGIAREAIKTKTPCIVVCGKSSAELVLTKELQILDIFALTEIAGSETSAIENALDYLEQIGEKLAKKHLSA